MQSARLRGAAKKTITAHELKDGNRCQAREKLGKREHDWILLAPDWPSKPFSLLRLARARFTSV